jgi:hypothetical protein
MTEGDFGYLNLDAIALAECQGRVAKGAKMGYNDYGRMKAIRL